MADVVAPRTALGALSVNNAQNVPSSRLSMGAKRGVGRPSLTSRRTSLHSTHQSTGGGGGGMGRPSLSASTSAVSTAPIGRRSSTHSRPSSLHGGGPSSSVRADPRPLHDKAYLKEQIHKIILYCLAHSYDRPLSPKLLLSPSSKDFRHLMEFLFQRIDPNFRFGPAVEDDIKRLMKALGYPFSLSKNALQAAGTPHTWPALLLMMAWMVDFLLYDEKVDRGGAEDGGAGEVDAHPERLFFEYLHTSYAAFIQGDDQAAAKLEEQLNNTFSVRHASASADIARLDAQRCGVQGELSLFASTGQHCAALRAKKAEYASDVAKFEQLLKDVAAHQEAVHSKVDDRRREAAEKKATEEQLKEEHAAIAATLAAQEFTPLQIQSMMHQQQTMQEALAELEQQKSRWQGERWEVERSLDAKVTALAGLVEEFNAVGVSIEVLPSSAKYANGQQLQLTLTADAASLLADDSQLTTCVDVVQPDMKALVKPVLVGLQSSMSGRVAALTSSSRLLHDEWVHLTEVRAERQRSLQATEAALGKREEGLKALKAEMSAQLQALVEEVEQVEGRLAEERGRRMREEREAAEKALADLEAEKGRREAEWTAERQREQAEMWSAIEELVSHAERIHQQLQHIAQQEQLIRQQLHKNPIPQQ